jgi:hypothetical protein
VDLFDRYCAIVDRMLDKIPHPENAANAGAIGGAAFGLIGGAIVGFKVGGVGGAIVFLLIGGVVGAVIGLAAAFYAARALFVVILGLPLLLGSALVVGIIALLWGVGN